jgi:flagellar hook-basal body complex protein FliE
MNVDNISAVAGINSLDTSIAATPASFSEQLLAEIAIANNKLVSAEGALQDVAAGKASNIHHVMLALEDAKLSFQLLVQVRNKLLEGYQDILRMQI